MTYWYSKLDYPLIIPEISSRYLCNPFGGFKNALTSYLSKRLSVPSTSHNKEKNLEIRGDILDSL